MADERDTLPIDELPFDDEPQTGSAEDTVADAPAPEVKRCWNCGKDLTGHRRLKEERGYICVPCAKEREASLTRCPTCRRKVKKDLLQRLGDRNICPRCFNSMKDDPRYKIFKVDTSSHDEHQKRNLYILAAVVAALLLMAALNWAGVL